MKKLLFGILTFLGIGLSFCSAEDITFTFSDGSYTPSSVTFNSSVSPNNLVSSHNCSAHVCYFHLVDSCTFVQNNYQETFYIEDCDSSVDISAGTYSINSWGDDGFDSIVLSLPGNSGGGEDTGSVSTIDVYYNNGNSVETITCDGIQAIEIKGLSTITSINTFTPYYNISYTDEDNQKLTESYSKDILYLENGQFKKTYTGNNDRILTYQGSSDSTFTGYVPVFDVTGSTQPIDTDYNMFNNFTDNSLKVLLSNIPGYIQYVFIIGIILLLLGIVKMFKRRK